MKLCNRQFDTSKQRDTRNYIYRRIEFVKNFDSRRKKSDLIGLSKLVNRLNFITRSERGLWRNYGDTSCNIGVTPLGRRVVHVCMRERVNFFLRPRFLRYRQRGHSPPPNSISAPCNANSIHGLFIIPSKGLICKSIENLFQYLKSILSKSTFPLFLLYI